MEPNVGAHTIEIDVVTTHGIRGELDRAHFVGLAQAREYRDLLREELMASDARDKFSHSFDFRPCRCRLRK